MNSTHERLFVRRIIKTKVKIYRDRKSTYNRGIKTVEKINESILLAGMTGKASYDKLLETDNEESLHKELQQQLIILRLLGRFPIYFSQSRQHTHTHTHTHRYRIYLLQIPKSCTTSAFLRAVNFGTKGLLEICHTFQFFYRSLFLPLQQQFVCLHNSEVFHLELQYEFNFFPDLMINSISAILWNAE